MRDAAPIDCPFGAGGGGIGGLAGLSEGALGQDVQLARQRKFNVELFVSDPSELVVDSVRSAEKNEVVHPVDQAIRRQIA